MQSRLHASKWHAFEPVEILAIGAIRTVRRIISESADDLRCSGDDHD